MFDLELLDVDAVEDRAADADHARPDVLNPHLAVSRGHGCFPRRTGSATARSQRVLAAAS